MSEKSASAGKSRFQAFNYKRRAKAPAPPTPSPPTPDKKAPPTNPVEMQEIETVDMANTTGSNLFAGSSLGELAQNPVKREVSPVAGQRCQAPKGEGICNAILSRHNPHTVPVCQPCAMRFSAEARDRGQDPDLKKIWGRIMAKRDAQAKSAELAQRPSGVQVSAPDSKVRTSVAEGEVPPKASVA